MRAILVFVILFISISNCFSQDGSPPIPPPPKKGKLKKNKIYEKVEIGREAVFPGGDSAYRKFLTSNLQAIADSAIERKIRVGVYVVDLTFIVNRDGSVTPNTAESKPKVAYLELLCMEMIKKSPQWLPTIYNGMEVKTYKRQPLTIKIEY